MRIKRVVCAYFKICIILPAHARWCNSYRKTYPNAIVNWLSRSSDSVVARTISKHSITWESQLVWQRSDNDHEPVSSFHVPIDIETRTRTTRSLEFPCTRVRVSSIVLRGVSLRSPRTGYVCLWPYRWHEPGKSCTFRWNAVHEKRCDSSNNRRAKVARNVPWLGDKVSKRDRLLFTVSARRSV